MKKITFVVMLILAISCSSSPRKIIDRADGYSSTPDWTLLSSELKESKGKILMVGRSEMSDDSNKIACLKSSEHQARVSLAQQLQVRIEGLTQSHLTSYSESFAETMKGIVSQNVPNAKVLSQYWQKEAEKKDDEHKTVRLQCFTQLSIDSELYTKIMKGIEESATEVS